MLVALRTYGIAALAIIVLIASVVQLGWRPSRYLWLHRPPRPGSDTGRKWLSHHEWLIVYTLVNSTVFVLSWRLTLNRSGSFVDLVKSLIESAIREPLTGAQVGAMLFAGALIADKQQSNGHVVESVEENSRGIWLWSMSLSLSANVLAFIDSLHGYAITHQVGPIHLSIWLAMNIGSIVMFALPLYMLARRKYVYLNSDRPGRALWPVVIPLAVLFVLDQIVPMKW